MVEDSKLIPEENTGVFETTRGPDVELFVRGSDENVVRFDPQRIIDALVREAHLDVDLAAKISLEIKQLIARSGIRALSSSLIRELVDVKLIEYGLEGAHRAHSRLGVPLYDAERIICQAAPEAVTRPHGPEGTSLTLAEAIKREYAITSVFSEDVANAHLTGDIYIQGIGAIDRPYSLISSIDYIKRHGMALPHNFSSSRPARYPEVLLAHLVKFTAALQGYLAGPIMWDSLNFALAPYLEGVDQRSMCQLAQSLIFDLSAPAVARGGQVVACNLHLDWDPPPYLAQRTALGPGGEETSKTYGEYTDSAREFLRAIFEVYLHGDASGRPFVSPRPILHITDQFATAPGYRNFLDLVSQAASEKGGIRIAFDREEARSYFLRFGVPFDAGCADAATWQWRSAALQSVALNLPRIGFRSDRQLVKVFERLSEMLEVVAQAHLEKRVFLERLMAMGENGPLALLAMRRSDTNFLRLSWTTFLICPVGMDELVFHLTGHHLHESDQAVETALKTLTHLRRELERLSSKHKVRFILAESNDEVTLHRLARQDWRSAFASVAAECISGDPSIGDVYYSNSLKVLPRARVSGFERIRIEGLLQHNDIFDAMTPIWLAEDSQAFERMAVFISRAFYQTHCACILAAPEFTICLSCGQPTRGLHDTCGHCGSSRIDGLAVSTDHFSQISVWNRGLLAQLRDRYRLNQNLE
jgi:ribonucleoside-triphosphate reductase